MNWPWLGWQQTHGHKLRWEWKNCNSNNNNRKILNFSFHIGISAVLNWISWDATLQPKTWWFNSLLLELEIFWKINSVNVFFFFGNGRNISNEVERKTENETTKLKSNIKSNKWTYTRKCHYDYASFWWCQGKNECHTKWLILLFFFLENDCIWFHCRCVFLDFNPSLVDAHWSSLHSMSISYTIMLCIHFAVAHQK